MLPASRRCARFKRGALRIDRDAGRTLLDHRLRSVRVWFSFQIKQPNVRKSTPGHQLVGTNLDDAKP